MIRMEMQIWILIILIMEIPKDILKFHIGMIGKMVKGDRRIKMVDYNLENFKEDIKVNREFEFSYNGKMYSLTFSKEGYFFTDICEEKDTVYNSYSDLLNCTKIEGKKIEEIIAEKLYDNLTIY